MMDGFDGGSVGSVARRMRSRLAGLYGEGEADAIVRLVFEHLKGWRPVDIVLHSDDVMSEFMLGKVDAIMVRLMRHEPVQYVLGVARFYGLTLSVDSRVLIPRRETEGLVDLVAGYIGDKEDVSILDACTGSGCIAIALGRRLRFPKITAFDFSDGALEVARSNAESLRVSLSLVKADALALTPDTLPGAPWDVLVANPPYIGGFEKASMEPNVLDYEPHSALFVPQNEPLIFYDALADYGLLTLRPSRGIFFEINPLYADALVTLMNGKGYTDVEVEPDIYGRKRFLTAHSPK